MRPTRLFDLIERQAAALPLDDALAAKVGDSWRRYSSQEVVDTARNVGLGLLTRHQIAKGERIALISMNRPEWVFSDIAIAQLGAVSVPLYPSATAKDYAYILGHSEATVALVSTTEIAQKLNSVRGSLPNLKAVYTFDTAPGITDTMPFSELLTAGQNATPELAAALQARRDSVTPQDLASIIYTSGTTGTPKGVMLSHQNILSNVLTVLDVVNINHLKRALSFLPLSHVFERLACYAYQYMGTSIYFAESVETIVKNLPEVKPHVMATVPRLLEKVYEAIVNKGHELTGFKRVLFDWSLKLGLTYDPDHPADLKTKLQLAVARKLVFSKWKAALGGELDVILIGGSALQPRLARVFWAAGIQVLEGYGLTETSPVIAFNSFTEHRVGSVGKPLPNLQLKIIQEEGYRAGEGEILVKGPSVMIGYFKNPEATAQAVDADGWFHTGDIGVLDDGYLRITDRKKEIFKTSGGKYIAPLAIENKLRESPLVAQVIVVGENQKFPSAIILPEFDNLRKWYAAQGKTVTSNAELIALPETNALLKEVVENSNVNFGQWEKIKQFRLVSDEWSIAGGELTPKLSIKRKVVINKYKDLIDGIYSGSKS
ncbi:MAG: long-chain fatty acid--CoA ligase [Deltaproteobacteria bacterium]|nr:long-chain fatty acid--CoA ligase [Deltaproteobacteria bacterium]